MLDSKKKSLKDNYQIDRILKIGDVGITYLAKDLRIQPVSHLLPEENYIVIKQLNRFPIKDARCCEEILNRLDLELTKFHHLTDIVQIANIREYFEQDQQFYLVYDYIEGEDLSKEIDLDKKWGEQDVINMLYEVLSVLDKLHQHNIIHQDIKPSNLIRHQIDSKISLTDFGSFKELATLKIIPENQFTTAIIGTQGYIPLEQIANKVSSKNTDLYALGMIAIQALSGIHPRFLPINSQREVQWKDQVNISDQLGLILDKMIAPLSFNRYQSANEIITDLNVLRENYLYPPIKFSISLSASLKEVSPVLQSLLPPDGYSLNISNSLNTGFKDILPHLKSIIPNQSGYIPIALSLTDSPYINSNPLNQAELVNLIESVSENLETVIISEPIIISITEISKGLIDPEPVSTSIIEPPVPIIESELIVLSESTELSAPIIETEPVVFPPTQLSIPIIETEPVVLSEPTELSAPVIPSNTSTQITVIETPIPNTPNSGTWNYKKIIGLGLGAVSIILVGLIPQLKKSWSAENSCSYLLKPDDAEKTLAACDQFLEENPNNPQAWQFKAKALKQLNRHDAAIIAYEKANHLEPKTPKFLENKADILYQLGRYEQALEVYEEIIKFAPHSLNALNGKGLTLLGLRQYQEALKTFNQAIEIAPKSARTWMNKAIALKYLTTPDQGRAEELEALAEAIALNDTILNKQPYNLEAMLSKAEAMSHANKFEQAEKLYNQVLELEPQTFVAQLAKANILQAQEKFTQALTEYDKAIKLQPNSYVAWHNRGTLLLSENDPVAAIQSFDQALQINENFAHAWRDKAIALAENQDYDNALTAIDQAIKLDRSDPKTWVHRGMIKSAMNKPEEAIPSFDKAIALQHNDSFAYWQRGLALEKLNLYTQALTNYETALTVDPSFEPVISARKRVRELIGL